MAAILNETDFKVASLVDVHPRITFRVSLKFVQLCRRHLLRETPNTDWVVGVDRFLLFGGKINRQP